MAGHRYTAEISWQCDGDYASNSYSRAHVWRFDGGVEVSASASPTVVPLPYSVEAAVDPEEAFIAAISSCHMLWFLDLARHAKLNVEKYTDKAEGVMSRIGRGKMAVTKVFLRPQITIKTDTPIDPEWLAALHEKAHDQCFIANSVTSEIEVLAEPVILVAP